MDIRSLIGMPLGYAISVLQKENQVYTIARTVSRSRFFVCDEKATYVIRAVQQENVVQLLVNDSLVPSESVQQVLAKGEMKK